jgi:ABC-type Mn2+/Zn2+ transport system ATPase subunit
VNNKNGNTPLAIEAKDLVIELGGVRVLESISFGIKRGSLIGVVGPNGAGKSTLFTTIAGLISPQQGKVLVHGLPPQRVRGRLAYVPQREQVNWRFPLTVWDVVMLGRSSRLGVLRRPGRADRETVVACLEKVGLLNERSALVSKLSGGQRQRVFVARALALEADVLLLDEAFSGVDVGSQEGLVEVLRALRHDGKTILTATHDLTNLARRFDEVLCINRHICAFGPPSRVFTPAVLEELYGAHGILYSNPSTAQAHGHDN